jgi:hypothetical protein
MKLLSRILPSKPVEAPMPAVAEPRRNPEGRKVDFALRVPPDRPVTFRDLIPRHVLESGYPTEIHEVKEFTKEEIEKLPVSKHHGPPYGWEKTGYLQPHNLIDTERHVVFTYEEFVRMRHDGGYESKTYVVHVNGHPLIEERGAYE